MNIDKKVIATLAGLLALITGVFAFAGKYETKEDHRASLESHDQNVSAHKVLLEKFIVPIVVAEVEKQHHRGR